MRVKHIQYRRFRQSQFLHRHLHLLAPVLDLLGPVPQHETRDGQLNFGRSESELHHRLVVVTVLEVVQAHEIMLDSEEESIV